jgi:hypothetical protein
LKLDWSATAPGMREVYLELFKQKFSKRDVGHVVRSLVYFAEADDDPPLRLLQSISWDQVKTDLRAAVAGLL